jgi:TRAP-type C4-dicarboxylate transport system permease small subunit
MRFLVRFIETVTEIFSGHVQAWLTMALMVLVMVDVTSRYVMRNPLAIGDEYGGFCLVAITCIGLAYAWHAALAAPFYPDTGHRFHGLHGVRGL